MIMTYLFDYPHGASVSRPETIVTCRRCRTKFKTILIKYDKTVVPDLAQRATQRLADVLRHSGGGRQKTVVFQRRHDPATSGHQNRSFKNGHTYRAFAKRPSIFRR